jgi:pentatricopeptide repeat protein
MVIQTVSRSYLHRIIYAICFLANALSFYRVQIYREVIRHDHSLCFSSLRSARPLSSSSTILRATKNRKYTNSSIDNPGSAQLPYADVIVADSKKSIIKPYRPALAEDIPNPLRNIVDVDVQKRTFIYEVEISQQAISSGQDLDILMQANRPTIGRIKPASQLEALGVRSGDVVVSTSATAGDQMWSHDSVESIRSALATRFVLYPSVKFRLERSLDEIDPAIQSRLMVPYIKIVNVRRPIGKLVSFCNSPLLLISYGCFALGLHVVEDGEKRGVFVQAVKDDQGAFKTKRIEIGDEIVAMSASWGDSMWEVSHRPSSLQANRANRMIRPQVHSVESFVVGVKMRTDPILSLKIRRYVPLPVYTDQIASARLSHRSSASLSTSVHQPVSSDPSALVQSIASNTKPVLESSAGQQPYLNINSAKNLSDLQELWKIMLSSSSSSASKYNEIMLNKLMSKALELEEAEFATEIFQAAVNFNSDEDDPPGSLLNIIRTDAQEESPAASSVKKMKLQVLKPTSYLAPNNYLCTTAIKAYGRQQRISTAYSLFQWFESQSSIQNNRADVFLLTALLYVCAKVPPSLKTAAMHYQQADRIFYEEFPKRGLAYSIPVINSMMYMHAKRNKPDEVIKLYDMAKSYGLQSSIATYGVIIKALLRSRNPALERKAFEILSSIPSMGLEINAEIFNQVGVANILLQP